MKKGKVLSQHEEMFAFQLKAIKCPEPEREYQFHETRKFRFDFAWPEKMIAVEIEGGTHSYGRHNRPEGFKNDCDKYNIAIQDGWKVFRFVGAHVKSGHAINFIEKELR